MTEPTTDPVPVVRARPPARRRWIAMAAAALVVVIAVVVTIVVVTGGQATRTPGVAPPPAADGQGSDAQITVSGDRILRGGEPWWFAGYNSFVWSGNCGNDDEKMSAEQVDAWFASMRHDGHGAVRLFFFPGWDLERLDAAVASAKANDLYVTITLDDAIAGCGESEKTEDWFDDPAETQVYRDHMVALLERYRGEHTIAWFEYFNEPDVDIEELRTFYDEMGALADTIDPERLFASGTIAPYESPVSFSDVHASPGVDIASMHEYDENEVESNHGPDTRAGANGKPVIVGEFGLYADADGADCERTFVERADQIAAKLGAYTTIPGYVGGFVWAWQPGGDDPCEYGNLDVDEAGQDVLRTYVP